MSNPFCTLMNVERRFGRTLALRSTTTEFNAGEVIGVAGPNGAGKSTLAQLTAGFLRPTAGKVTIAGISALEYRQQHGVGFLPEELPRGWKCTVLEFLAMRVVRSAVLTPERIVELLGLDSFAEKPLTALSKGQWRLALAGYAALGPSRVVILDEPDSGLDPNALDRLRQLISACRSAESLVLILSHQMTELDAVCDRLLFIARGSLIAEASSGDLQNSSAAQLYRELIK